MKMEFYQINGGNMFTKILRKIVRKIECMKNGHCSGDDDGGGSGHCS